MEKRGQFYAKILHKLSEMKAKFKGLFDEPKLK